MPIQLIEKQGNNWHIVINGISCIFTNQLSLYTDGLYPVKPDCSNGLRWRIGRKWVSYKQIKKAICKL